MPEQKTYYFLGWMSGTYVSDRDGRSYQYFNVFVCSPLLTESERNSDYAAFGYKAEKLKAVNEPDWKSLNVGDKITFYFDQYQRVCCAKKVD